jgi:hypothetical protein
MGHAGDFMDIAGTLEVVEPKPKNLSTATNAAARASATDAHAGATSGTPSLEETPEMINRMPATVAATIAASLKACAPSFFGTFFSRYQLIALSASSITNRATASTYPASSPGVLGISRTLAG